MKLLTLCLLILLVSACSDDTPNNNSSTDAGEDQSLDMNQADQADQESIAPIAAVQRGEFEVGNTTVQWEDPQTSRLLDVEIWYPAKSGGSEDVLAFESGDNLQTYTDLLAAAPECPSRVTTSARGAVPAAGVRPVIVFSHCHSCTRYSSLSMAEHLTSWGFIVVAPDHEGNTLYDELRGDGASVGKPFLEVRLGDIQFVLDQVLKPERNALPQGLRNSIDTDRVGMMGHSFGSVTAGYAAQEDSRIKAVLGLAAPMESPLLPGIEISRIDKPLLLLVASEDNSITSIGNRLLADNFDAAVNRAWKVEVADAGHWTISDLAGLTDFFAPGCGEDTRMTNGDDFTYIDNTAGRLIGGAYATAFFLSTLTDTPGATEFLNAQPPWEQVSVETRGP